MQSSGGRDRTCLSRVTAARLADSTTPERRSVERGRRGSRTPKAASEATRFRDGVPRRWQSFQSDPGRRRTCNPPGKRRELCQLSYGAVIDVTGRDRTCDAPRFRRALYRAELRSRARWAEPESNRRPPPYQRGALPPELSAGEWARLGSNQQPLVCETSALPLSYSPESNPGQGVEPRSPRSERGVLPVRRSRNDEVRRAPLRPSPEREIDAAGARLRRGSRCHLSRRGLRPNDVFHATRLPFDPGSPTALAHSRGRRPTWRSFGARGSAPPWKSAC